MLVVAVAIAGATAPAGGPPLREIRVAIVQGGGSRGLNQLQVPPGTVFRAAVAPTESLRGHLDLVLWPEDVVSLDGPLSGSDAEVLLASLARRLHTTLAVGVTEPVGSTLFRNEIVAFAPDGRVAATFEKVHRVPFGEYVPFRSFFSHLANLNDVPRDAIPGSGSGMIATPAGRFAVLVSYEVFFAERARSGVHAGGEMILVPTNTSSYSSSQAPSQEIAASRLRAVEEGRDLLQAAPTGYSAVVTPQGQVIDQSPLGSRYVIEATVPLRDGSTLYEQLGDLPLVILAALLAIVGWVLGLQAPPRRSRLRRKTRQGSAG